MEIKDFVALSPSEAHRVWMSRPQKERPALHAAYLQARGLRLSALEEEAAHQPPADTAEASAAEGGALGLQTVGGIMILGGAVLAIMAFAFDVSARDLGIYGSSEVANLDKIAVRHMILGSGAALFISGWIALGLERVREAIRDWARPNE